jgi:hypothetical protein
MTGMIGAGRLVFGPWRHGESTVFGWFGTKSDWRIERHGMRSFPDRPEWRPPSIRNGFNMDVQLSDAVVVRVTQSEIEAECG